MGMAMGSGGLFLCTLPQMLGLHNFSLYSLLLQDDNSGLCNYHESVKRWGIKWEMHFVDLCSLNPRSVKSHHICSLCKESN